MVDDLYAVANRIRLYQEHAGDDVIQIIFDNGSTHYHNVRNVFVFAPNGWIIASAINAPD